MKILSELNLDYELVFIYNVDIRVGIESIQFGMEYFIPTGNQIRSFAGFSKIYHVSEGITQKEKTKNQPIHIMKYNKIE